jgi:deazaflavin-dependent oxidoreductase (nitroreductase family)
MILRNWNFRQKPTGVWKHVLRIPVHLFHARLGFLMGDRVLLLTHIGRTTGVAHETALEVVAHDRDAREYFVCSGTGPGADWYRNLLAAPAPFIQVGARSWRPVQRFVADVEAAGRFARYEARHPRMSKRLLRSMGNSYDGSDRGRIEMMARMPMVAFSGTILLFGDGSKLPTLLGG